MLAKTAFIRAKIPTTSGFPNTKSINCNSGTKSISRTQGAGSRQKMTFSFWIYHSDIANSFVFISNGSSTDYILVGGGAVRAYFNNASAGLVLSSGSFSNNTWYHVVVQIDTSNAAGANRCRVFINGSDVTYVSTTVTQNYNTGWGNSGTTETNINYSSGALYVDELAKIDNSLVSASSFATAGKPIDLSTLTFGSQGYWLRFETGLASTIGTDSSPNGLTFTNSNYVDGDFVSTVP